MKRTSKQTEDQIIGKGISCLYAGSSFIAGVTYHQFFLGLLIDFLQKEEDATIELIQYKTQTRQKVYVNRFGSKCWGVLIESSLCCL
jgi:hypothetical protein